MTASRGIASDPEYRRERARIAGLAGNTIDNYIKRLVDRAPELTQEQRDRLALLLSPGGVHHAAS